MVEGSSPDKTILTDSRPPEDDKFFEGLKDMIKDHFPSNSKFYRKLKDMNVLKFEVATGERQRSVPF